MMFTARIFRKIALVLFAWIVGLLVCVRVTPGQGNDTRFQIGSSNTVTADPLVPRPHEQPCIVQLFSDFQFVNFNVQSYQFTPPAGCPAPWEKVVFTADFNVSAGRQFDRSAIVDMGFVNLYFGTTPEPRHNLAPFWHVERDVTDYSCASPNSDPCQEWSKSRLYTCSQRSPWHVPRQRPLSHFFPVIPT